MPPVKRPTAEELPLSRKCRDLGLLQASSGAARCCAQAFVPPSVPGQRTLGGGRSDRGRIWHSRETETDAHARVGTSLFHAPHYPSSRHPARSSGRPKGARSTGSLGAVSSPSRYRCRAFASP